MLLLLSIDVIVIVFEIILISWQVAEFKWHSTSTAFIIVFWLFLACIAKLSERKRSKIKNVISISVFNRASSLTKIFPESSLLIAVGLAIGVLLEVTNAENA